MRNIDNTSTRFVHLYVALRRKKDNPDLPQLCFRQIIVGSEEVALRELESRLQNTEGIWRIHKTINKRSTLKATQLLQHKLIDNFEDVAKRLISEWKTCLMVHSSKAERNILLDIDSDEAFKKVYSIINTNSYNVLYSTRSVSGFHVILKAEDIDTRLFSAIPDVTLQRDGYVFIKQYRSY